MSACSCCSNFTARYTSRITSVSGNGITLERPLPWTLQQGMEPVLVRRQAPVYDVGLEGFTLQVGDGCGAVCPCCVPAAWQCRLPCEMRHTPISSGRLYNPGRSPSACRSPPQVPYTPYLGHHKELGLNAIHLLSTQDCWVTDVRIVNADNGILIEEVSAACSRLRR